jgi:RNA polymerase sigma-70 factor (ECF subfamily)
MNRRKSKFAPAHELSLEQLMPDRKELEQLSSDGKINPESFAIRSEEASHLRNAVQKLPPQYRIVLVLRDMEGLTDDEVAEITGLRAGTVRVRLHRARLFVRKELMRTYMRHASRKAPTHVHEAEQFRPGRCKAMFAELSDYLEEQLDDSLCEELEQHLDSCGPCRVFVASLEAAIEQCRASPADAPSRTKALKLCRQLVSNYQRAVARNSGQRPISSRNG